jgi:hypothetical protein
MLFSSRQLFDVQTSALVPKKAHQGNTNQNKHTHTTAVFFEECARETYTRDRFDA